MLAEYLLFNTQLRLHNSGFTFNNIRSLKYTIQFYDKAIRNLNSILS